MLAANGSHIVETECIRPVKNGSHMRQMEYVKVGYRGQWGAWRYYIPTMTERGILGLLTTLLTH